MKIIILATLLITLIGCSSGSSFKAYSYWEEEKLPRLYCLWVKYIQMSHLE
jgi:hypothetical protein